MTEVRVCGRAGANVAAAGDEAATGSCRARKPRVDGPDSRLENSVHWPLPQFWRPPVRSSNTLIMSDLMPNAAAQLEAAGAHEDALAAERAALGPLQRRPLITYDHAFVLLCFCVFILNPTRCFSI